MNELFSTSLFFGGAITAASYLLGAWIQRRTKKAYFNPILIAVILVISFLLVFRVDYETYQKGAAYITYFLTPATVCLAVPMYEQLPLLKKYWKEALTGICTGVIVSLGSVCLLSMIMHLSHAEYVTFLPKSITSAIGMDVSAELGGYTSLTVAVIILTGILGNVTAEAVLRLFHIKQPIAKGIAIGSSSHAIGTSRALEIGPVEGAMSSLSIVVAGVITVVLAVLFSTFL